MNEMMRHSAPMRDVQPAACRIQGNGLYPCRQTDPYRKGCPPNAAYHGVCHGALYTQYHTVDIAQEMGMNRIPGIFAPISGSKKG